MCTNHPDELTFFVCNDLKEDVGVPQIFSNIFHNGWRSTGEGYRERIPKWHGSAGYLPFRDSRGVRNAPLREPLTRWVLIPPLVSLLSLCSWSPGSSFCERHHLNHDNAVRAISATLIIGQDLRAEAGARTFDRVRGVEGLDVE